LNVTSLPQRARRRLAAGLVVASMASGCAVEHRVVPQAMTPLAQTGPAPVAWLAPSLAGDLTDLGRWRQSVGPPVVMTARTAAAPANRLVVVNWNTHVGGGDVPRLYQHVRNRVGPNVPIVFLLQEAYRAGPEVPASLNPTATFASVIRSLRRDGKRDEVEAVASSLGLHAYYVPSMRNGGPLTSDEDRGNAILSTVPLTDLSAIELPFERQRRVAVAATVSGATTAGQPWRLRVVSAHLDNMSGARRLWIAGGEFGRTRQARGLVSALGDHAPLVLGADMNTLFGFRDAAYTATARAFPDTRVTDRRATFHGILRLDHLFFRLDDGWRGSFERTDDNFGSDHYPLVGEIVFTGSSS
jgi:endonuclease/exonuclease/phosphatase family metal-dependent hydrolase